MTKFFCPAPWKAIYSHVNEMAVCCASTQKFKLSPKEFLDSDYLAELREKFLRGESDNTCSVCINAEAAGLQSIRQHFVERYGEDIKENLSHMELRASNLCNFQCKMCDADSSSLIAGNIKTVSDSNWQEILELSENLKSLTLTGGEPMIIKQYYQLLDSLIEKNKTNIILRIYTNCSSYNPIFIEKFLKFRTVLHLSIDGIEHTAELQRAGTDWNLVKDNILKFINLPVGIVFHTTITSLNIIDIFSLSKYFVEMNKLKPKLFFVAHSVDQDHELSLLKLDKESKKIAIRNLDDSIEILNDPCFVKFKNELISIKNLLC
jgi:sulfatase maturation enzyme AslB (radical SAM superfamily)